MQRAVHDPRAHQPRIDVFGTLSPPGGAHARGRLIEYAPDEYAFFPADEASEPYTFRASGEFQVRGRVFRTTLADGGPEVSFQKAGCGCETPQHLRGSRRPLLERLPATRRLLEPDVGAGPLLPQETQAP